MNNQTNEAVRIARKKSDVTVLIITVLIALGFVGFMSIGSPDVLIFVIVSLLASLFYVSLFQVRLLASSMRVQNGKHAFLLDIANEITTNLKVPPVDIYITQDPYLNAFAIGYTRPFSIVLNSAVVERLSEKEIKAILLHEIGHVIYHHTIITSYIAPLSSLPVVGAIITWVFGFWSRRAELTCDRLATAYTRDSHSVMSALIDIHVGAGIGEYMGEEGVIYQDIKGRGLMRKISQSLQTHPFLVTRVSEIINFSNKNGIALPDSVVNYLK